MNHEDDWDNRVAGRRNSRGDVSEAGASLTVLTTAPRSVRLEQRELRERKGSGRS